MQTAVRARLRSLKISSPKRGSCRRQHTHTCLNQSKFPGPFRHPLAVWPGFVFPPAAPEKSFAKQTRLENYMGSQIVGPDSDGRPAFNI